MASDVITTYIGSDPTLRAAQRGSAAVGKLVAFKIRSGGIRIGEVVGWTRHDLDDLESPVDFAVLYRGLVYQCSERDVAF